MRDFRAFEEYYSLFCKEKMHVPDDAFLSSRYQEIGLIVETNLQVYNDMLDSFEKKKILIEGYK